MAKAIKVRYSKELHEIEFDPTSIRHIGDLKAILARKTNTKIDSIKLIIEGKQLKNEFSMMKLMDAGCPVGETVLKITENTCLTMIATKILTKEVEAPKIHLSTRIINDLSTDGVQPQIHPSQLRTNKHQVERKRTEYEFHRIEVLPGLPDQDKAMEILVGLANDPAVLAVMKKHKWSVGLLAELYPEGKVGEDEVCILGLNTNKGQKIELRIRTDDLKGFRKIQSIKKTLYHELTHNVHGPHDNQFYTLLRQVEKEIIELDWRANQGGYSVQDDGKVTKKYASDQYIPSQNESSVNGTQAKKTIYRLQDSSTASTSSSSSSMNLASTLTSIHQIFPASMMAAQAAVLRLTEEEMENEKGCGCGRVSDEIENDIKEIDSEILCMDCDDEGDNNDNDVRKDRLTENIEKDHDAHVKVDDVKELRRLEMETNENVPPSPPPDMIDLINVSSVVQEISDSLDESIALALNMESSSSIERLLMIRDSVRKILGGMNIRVGGSYSRREVYNSLDLLRTFIKNAKDLPDEKYRSIKANSKKFENLIIRIDGAMNLLEATGFERCEDEKKVQLKRFDPGLLYMAFSFVDLCLNVIDRAMNETAVFAS